MREVHRFIADYILLSDHFEEAVRRVAARKLEPTGRKVAVAGAGPAGLTAAFYLALLGTTSRSSIRCPKLAECCASPCRNIACPNRCCAAKSS